VPAKPTEQAKPAEQSEPVAQAQPAEQAEPVAQAQPDPPTGPPTPSDPVTRAADAERDRPVGERDRDEYSHLTPLLLEHAASAADAPRRRELRDQLITGFLPVARHLAGRFAQRGVPLEDLVQIATVGLINAVDRFDPERGREFLAFAIPTIQGELRRYFRDHSWSVRVPRRLKELRLSINTATAELTQSLGRAPRPSELAARLDISREEVLEGLAASAGYASQSLDQVLTEGEDRATLADLLGRSDSRLESVEAYQTLRTLLQHLPARERTILVLRFFENQTQSSIAAQVGISQMHVSRLLANSLSRLRAHLREDELAG
jgi:RNA polymerase sigma-B factor